MKIWSYDAITCLYIKNNVNIMLIVICKKKSCYNVKISLMWKCNMEICRYHTRMKISTHNVEISCSNMTTYRHIQEKFLVIMWKYVVITLKLAQPTFHTTTWQWSIFVFVAWQQQASKTKPHKTKEAWELFQKVNSDEF